ncbi:hypothetical protein B9W68_12325 [Streptomyces sp. CS227]|uniref:hypothetical protein n=1 Tax=Streptomyces sp. CS227 TaxID=1982763 RepID=UPI000B422B4C|nr:hypothetical protein [Streptomyces sp. CS227]OWA12949.1 hypothetical protein B9W68_12325 [Streptomyces sp. CS227]
MRRYGAGTATAAALVLLALAGCGTSPDSGGKGVGDPGEPPPAAREKGPACVGEDTGTAGLDANCATVPVAGYEDVRAGDTVEFAGAECEVAALSDKAVRLTRTSG